MPQGGGVLAAGRAREVAANGRDQPQALERRRVSDAVKGPLRRAVPSLDRAFHARQGPTHRLRRFPGRQGAGSALLHTKRWRPSVSRHRDHDFTNP